MQRRSKVFWQKDLKIKIKSIVNQQQQLKILNEEYQIDLLIWFTWFPLKNKIIKLFYKNKKKIHNDSNKKLKITVSLAAGVL